MVGALMEKHMGLMKNVLIENKFNRKLAAASLGNESMICRYCGSRDVKYFKSMGFGKIAGKIFHYKLICNSCGKRYHVKRTKQIYDIVKFQNWEKSKSFVNNERGLL